MKVHLLIDVGEVPIAIKPREMDRPPRPEDVISADIEGVTRQLSVVAVQHFRDDPEQPRNRSEAWVICKVL